MRAAICLAVTMWLCSCATKPASVSSDVAPSEDSRLAIRNQGYSLLYKLMSDEKHVSKILVIKKEQSDVNDLVKKIAQVTGETAKELAALSKGDPHLHLNMDGLPIAEK